MAALSSPAWSQERYASATDVGPAERGTGHWPHWLSSGVRQATITLQRSGSCQQRLPLFHFHTKGWPGGQWNKKQHQRKKFGVILCSWTGVWPQIGSPTQPAIPPRRPPGVDGCGPGQKPALRATSLTPHRMGEGGRQAGWHSENQGCARRPGGGGAGAVSGDPP